MDRSVFNQLDDYQNIPSIFLMGNIQQIMENLKPIQEYEGRLKNVRETRSQTEIQLTNRLFQLLSHANSERMLSSVSRTACLDWSSYVFLCIHGFPADQTEFDFVGFPSSRVLHYLAISFQNDEQQTTEQQKMQRVLSSTFEQESERLNQFIQHQIRANEEIIILYHSAGNCILSMYFYHYPAQRKQLRIKGMIDIAGCPMRYYPTSKPLTPLILETNFNVFVDNADKVHKMLKKMISGVGFDIGLANKYQTLSFIRYVKSKDYGELFEATKQHPKVLKLIIHGLNDTLFDTPLLNEKAINFAYKQQLDPDYQRKLIQKYDQLYKTPKAITNVQERFMIGIPNGQHSVHRNPKAQQLIRVAIHQYLSLIHQ